MPSRAPPSLADLLDDATASAATLEWLGAESLHSRTLLALAEQAVVRGIDYASLGLNWDHPQSRIEYRRAEGVSFSKPASRARQAKSRAALTSLVVALAALPSSSPEAERLQQAERLIVGSFVAEIGALPAVAENATFAGVAACLEGELLLPLRAFTEGIASMYTTFGGSPVPARPVQEAVRALVGATLANRLAEWRYTNPVGVAQLEGLTAAQIAKWREPTSSTHESGRDGGQLTVRTNKPHERRQAEARAETRAETQAEARAERRGLARGEPRGETQGVTRAETRKETRTRGR